MIDWNSFCIKFLFFLSSVYITGEGQKGECQEEDEEAVTSKKWENSHLS